MKLKFDESSELINGFKCFLSAYLLGDLFDLRREMINLMHYLNFFVNIIFRRKLNYEKKIFSFSGLFFFSGICQFG